ncbi:hypothetical protein C1H46_008036 [Malus baccata]|uniref:Tf2-1-like SH3-like domain-containing protein n=1 Tax=Malus baccata TaxID=106549 RepID=A0A540N5K5_MALBA|nr:hypothetical protein C1H46_008036 [Malus baccata]
MTHKHLQETSQKYKAHADSKRGMMQFDVGDFVWAVLVKDRFSVGNSNKLFARKIGSYEILKKINLNAYRLKLPSHIRTSDVLNVKPLIPFKVDKEDTRNANSMANFLQPGEDDADMMA